jgi:hypothetical protein
MLWPTVSAVGFLLMTALVIALARSRTARWEREKRAARAPRDRRAAPPRTPARSAARLRAELERTAAAVGRAAVRTRAMPQAVGRMPAVARKLAASRMSTAHRPAVRVAGTGKEGAPNTRTAPGRRRLRRGVARHGLGRATGRLPRRLAARFVNRHDGAPAPQERQAGADGSTTAQGQRRPARSRRH